MSNGTVEQKTSNHSDVSLSDLKVSNFASLNSFLIDELEVNLSINLSDDLKNIIKTYLSEYESLNQRKLEEKDSVISQLKQSLLDLTEKRFRASIQNGSSSLPYENIEFLINEKEAKINQLLDQLSENERDINKLKQTINSQDDVILSLNNNIYELKNSNQTVLKAKQESFKLMNEDLNSKQKLIEEQSETIRELNEKTKRLEDELKKAHTDLEKRLNEKQTDLQIKIAQFEANLHEGKIYFEDVLAEKSKEINRLKSKLESLGQSGDDEIQNGEELNRSNINKFDSDNIKNIKALYEHQIDILKVKIEMLEKTCTNYQQGIKEMNKNFGIQQLSDEVNSIQTFKDLMQDLQKTNVNLETEKIDLQVNNSKLQSQLDQTRIEKENLNKKFHTADQLNQRLSQEKHDLDTHYRSLLNSKESELAEINQKFHHLNIEYDQLSQDNSRLVQISLDYEQLKTTNQELTDHYEQLCHQATDIVNGNQMLNEQVESSHVQIEQLRSQVNDLQLEVDHLSNCNSELNTQKVNYELKVEDLEIKMQEIQPELDELEALRRLNLDINSLNEQLKDLRLELEDKNELIEQLNQAKEFLAENNCKLLTNNIKIQLFVESLGLDQSEIENSQRVKEYDDLMDKVSKYESEILGLRIKLEEIRLPDKTGLDQESQFDSLTEEMDQLRDRLASNEKLTLKLKAKLKQMLKNSAKCQENEAQTENGEYVQFLMDFGAKMAQEKIEKDVEDSLNALKCDVQRLLLSKELKSDKSLNTSQDFDYRDQIFSLEAQLNQKMNQMVELTTRCEHQQEIIDSMDISVVAELKNRIELMQNELRIKDEQIDALSDWGASVPQKSQANTDKIDQIEELKKQKELVGFDLVKNKQEFDQEIKNASSLKEKLESRIKELEDQVRIKDEQIDALSDWGSSFVNKSEDQKDDNSQIESLEAKINGLNEEIDVLTKEKEVAVSDLAKNKEEFNKEIEKLTKNKDKYMEDLELKIEQLENEVKIKDEQKDALSDWGSSVPDKPETEKSSSSQIESLEAKINGLNEEIDVLKKDKEAVLLDLEKNKETFDQEIKNLNNLKEKQLFMIGELELKIKELENEVKIKDEQLEALSDWNSSAPAKPENEKDNKETSSRIECLEAKINVLNQENDALKKEKEAVLSNLEINKEEFYKEIENLTKNKDKCMEDLELKIEQLENEVKIKDEQIDALSDWGSSVPDKPETEKSSSSQIESFEAKINGLNEEIDVLKKDKEAVLLDLEKNKEEFYKEIENLTKNKDKYMEDLELKIEQLENEVKIKDEQKDALSDWGSSVPDKPETEKSSSSQIESFEAKINGLNEEIDVLKKDKEAVLLDLEKNKETFDQEIKNLNNLKEKQLFMIGELELKIKELENEVKIKDEQLEAVSDWAQGSQNKSENEDQVEGLKHQVLDLQVDLKAKLELIESLEKQLKNVDQELEAVKCNKKHLENELVQSQASKQETRLENVQLLGNSTSSDETIELKAHVNQIMIELSIKNDQLVSLESFLNEQKIESQKMIEKLTFESESWKKKYESMRLKALALRDKCKKFELGQCLDDGRASPSNSSKSSMDSSSLAEHLFHNLQAEYKEFKRTHEDQINELNSLLISAQTHLDQYKQDYNEEKINHVHQMYTDQLKQYELNFESIQSQNDHFKLELNQLTDKYSHIEKQNLKLKAKLKQVLAKSKEDHLESQKMSSDTMQIQAGLDEALEKKIVLQVVHAESQTNPLELFSTQCQTEDQELECLKLQNEQYKCLIEDLEKNQFGTETKAELDELREKVKVVQDQNLKLKAKLKQVMGQNQKVAKIDSECQTELENLVQKECEMENLLKKISYLEELVGQKEKMNQDMRSEISGLKEWIEKQRSDYENQISCLNAELVGKETSLVQIKEELCGLRSQSEISMVSALPSSLMSESVVLDETASSASSNLENQLKFCHEKCEKVVAKLGLLRKQNESLNSKIKTIKSMIVS